MNESLTTQVSGKAVLKAPETGLLVFILMITFKTCNLPSVLFADLKESSVWCILTHCLMDGILLIISLYIASLGGIQSKNIPKLLRKVASTILFFFFLFKLSAAIYEMTTSVSSVLFENSLIFPIFALVLIATAVIGSKGFTGIGRLTLIFAWIAVFILVFNIFFLGFDGYAFNLYPVLRPTNYLKGLVKEAIWFGEPLILMTADLSPKFNKKQNGFVAVAYISAVFSLVGFYLLLIFTYGEVAGSVNNAFSRVLTMNRYSNELGAVDWPMIVLWLISGIIHVSCLFAGCKQCFNEVCGHNKKVKLSTHIIFYLLTVGIPVVFYFTLFDNVLYTAILSATQTGIISLIISYGLPILIGIVAYIKYKKEPKKESECGEEQS